MKHLVVCCDGTWNSPDNSTITNVAKISRRFSNEDTLGNPQIIYYHSGVGTSSFFDLSHWIGGAFGVGLSSIIIDLYRFLIQNYVEDDKITLLGFSRGAYAVRSLASLIYNCGILHKIYEDKIPLAYELYRRTDSPSDPMGIDSILFRKNYAREASIHCIGVWETVGSLGIPGHISRRIRKLWEFHDVSLSPNVQSAFHALAIDEHRKSFSPTLWELPHNTNYCPPGQLPKQVLKQMWFCGSHSNVGGGCRVTGLSDVALNWMIDNVIACGLSCGKDGIEENPLGYLIKSRTGVFCLIPLQYRPILQNSNTNEEIHPSVRLRHLKLANYSPRNIGSIL